MRSEQTIFSSERQCDFEHKLFALLSKPAILSELVPIEVLNKIEQCRVFNSKALCIRVVIEMKGYVGF